MYSFKNLLKYEMLDIFAARLKQLTRENGNKKL